MFDKQGKILGGNDTLINSLVNEKIYTYFHAETFEPKIQYTCPYKNITPLGNLTIDYIEAQYGEPFKLYSFLLAIVIKIMCELRLRVRFVAHAEGFYNYTTLLLDPIPLDVNGTKKGDIVATQQVYMIEVMTTLANVESSTYFSFFYLFGVNIWIVYAISIVINASLFNLTNERQMSWGKSLRNAFRSVIGQPIVDVLSLLRIQSRSPERRRKMRTFIMLLGIWLLMSTTLQRCISSVLLNSYLKQKPEPLFEDMHDIYESGVKIAGMNSIQYLKENSKFHLVKNERFIHREYFPISTDDVEIIETINLVLKGKAVIFDETYGMEQKELMFKEISRLIVMENKYFPTYTTFFVNKQVKYKREILRLILNGIEAGLYWHYRMVEQVKIEIRRGLFKYFHPVEFNALIDFEQDKYALELSTLWKSVFSVLIIGYVVTIVILFIEIIYSNYFQNNIKQKVNIIMKTQSANSLLHRIFTNRKGFIKRARRLKSIQYDPKQVHKQLRYNYRLYFEKF